jgi:hypothetical protein
VPIMAARRKLILAGAAFVVCAGLLIWFINRPQAWNSSALTVVWSDATETFDLDSTGKDFKHHGFTLYYSLQNNTGNDATIPADAMVMKRLSRGHTLTDFSGVLKLRKAYFVPARQRAQIEVDVEYGCGEEDMAGHETQRDARICFKDALGDAEGLVVFDKTQKIQINLPKPDLK